MAAQVEKIKYIEGINALFNVDGKRCTVMWVNVGEIWHCASASTGAKS